MRPRTLITGYLVAMAAVCAVIVTTGGPGTVLWGLLGLGTGAPCR